jgi:cysteinyl-tRNA synthetase
MSQLRVFNSLSGKKEIFKPASARQVTWYMCGPTVYDHAHIGHARTFVSFDIVRRVMESMFNFSVHQIWGVTDVDDKIINRARECQISPSELSSRFEKEFWRDMNILNVKLPIAATRVSDHIPDIIAFIEKIISNGFAYQTSSGSVYFDTRALGGKYGIFKTLEVEVPDANEGDGDLQEKRHKADFALWKGTKSGEELACWDSPFGKGRPGWHIECSAMSTSHFPLPDSIDIHTGGIDLKFPHHENELAQCNAHGCAGNWVRYWMHSGHLHIDGRKMSKSLKNFVTISELFQSGYSSDQFRMFCLMNHYRTHTTFSADRMVEAQSHIDRLQMFIDTHKNLQRADAENPRSNIPAKWGNKEQNLNACLQDTNVTVMNAFANDFDFRAAILSILALTAEATEYSQSSNSSPSLALLNTIHQYVISTTRMVGLNLGTESTNVRKDSVDEWINTVVKLRADIRDAAKLGSDVDEKTLRRRLFELTDRVRKDCGDHGVTILDTQGTPALWARVPGTRK